MSYDLVEFETQPSADEPDNRARGFSERQCHLPDRRLHPGLLPDTAPLLAIVYTFLSWLALSKATGRSRLALTTLALALIAALCFMGKPLALVGTPFIIIATFVVRSLPGLGPQVWPRYSRLTPASRKRPPCWAAVR